MKSDIVFSRQSDEWSTPQDLFDTLNAEFHFTLDGAATAENTKCVRWYGPGSVWEDALEMQPVGERIFLNPPYSRNREFLSWLNTYGIGNVWVVLVPSRTDTRWWHEYVWNRFRHEPYPGIQIRFLKGRLRFGGAAAGAPFPSVVIVFRS